MHNTNQPPLFVFSSLFLYLAPGYALFLFTVFDQVDTHSHVFSHITLPHISPAHYHNKSSCSLLHYRVTFRLHNFAPFFLFTILAFADKQSINDLSLTPSIHLTFFPNSPPFTSNNLKFFLFNNNNTTQQAYVLVRKIGKQGAHSMQHVIYLGVVSCFVSLIGLYTLQGGYVAPQGAWVWSGVVSLGVAAFFGQVLLNSG